ncbi:hypothetical protein DW322_12485 [Rhodococcus rhodnii]|uniref:YCII-related domain-containing protein n=2 Tax=Rhodococcus rhodnii TaxID=38312 RepID=R7WP41_9NOCA|nr:YciI family protein [Rhodococcus rhodnii]EOM77086.1 hypothetical protein Rrhod_1553 [Rhodococcus rhodnii LMG 5362]TXG90893.1 hypothetical protein DW322_12485 [Rhodococcus rhodnii]
MPIFVVHYSYAPEQAADRDRVRPDHRSWLSGLVEEGVVVSTGPLADGSGAVLLLRGDDEAAVRSVLEHDPFATAGLVASMRLAEWTPVLGVLAE